MRKKDKIKRLGVSKMVYDNGRYNKESIFERMGTWIAIFVFSLFALYFLLPYIVIFKAAFISS